MNPVTSFLVFAFLAAAMAAGYLVNPFIGIGLFAVAVVIGMSLKMANVWQKFVVLRMGKLQGVKGAGLFAIIPVLDTVVAVIDERIQTTAFNAEQALTRDTVPVNVDAISSGTSMMPRRPHWPLPTTARRLIGLHRPRCAK